MSGMIPLVDRAYVFAKTVHRGQTRWCGSDYFLNHPLIIAERFKDPIAKTVALLHDTIEDGDDPDKVTEQLDFQFGEFIMQCVMHLSRNKDIETYSEYIDRVRKCGVPVVIAVKIADLEHNLSDLKAGNMRIKYELSLLLMNDALSEQSRRNLFKNKTGE